MYLVSTKKKVLVCTDNPVIIFMLKSLIAKEGIDVVTALNGLEGLKIINNQPILII